MEHGKVENSKVDNNQRTVHGGVACMYMFIYARRYESGSTGSDRYRDG